MKKAIIFFLGVITGRYLITFVDRAVSILFYGHHDADYIPFTKQKKYVAPFHRSYRPYATSYSIYRPQSKRFYGIIFNTRSQAEDVLDKCIESIDNYGFCSVLDFKDYAMDTLDKFIPSVYSDKYYVWKDLKNAKVLVTRLGYEIDFPMPEYKEEED